MSNPKIATVNSDAVVVDPVKYIVRNATLKIIGENSVTQLKVCKELICSKSSIIKDLFDNAPNGGVEIQERETAQLVTFLESVHSPAHQNSLQSLTALNACHAKLACKYFMNDYVERFKQLMKIELKRLTFKTQNNDFVVTSLTSATSIMRGSSHVDLSDDVIGKYTYDGEKWTKVAKNGSLCTFSIHDDKLNFQFASEHLEANFPDKAPPMGQSNWYSIPARFRVHIMNIVRSRPFVSPPTCDTLLFWEIVDAALTHDGLKLHEGDFQLCNSSDLVKLLTENKPYHLWEMNSMQQHLTIEQITKMCIDVM